MSNKTLRAAIIGIIAISSLTVSSELRMWTDKSGKTIEAEHVRTLTDKVVLKKADGTEIQVALDTLSERDRKYAILQTPPRIDISVSTNTDRENKGFGGNVRNSPGIQIQRETVMVDVKIKKASSQPYEAPMRAELYVIGSPENKDAYIILDKKASRFQFTSENENTHAFSSDSISLKQLEAGIQKGIEYKGYIVVIRDKTRSVIQMKCSKLDFEKNGDAIIGAEKGAIFDEDFKPIVRVKEKPAEQNGQKNHFPGRRF